MESVEAGTEQPTLVAGATAVAPGATLAAPDGGAPAADPALGLSKAPPRGVTVLPRLESEAGEHRLVQEARTRYEQQHVLGEGGMGVVALAHDRDIDRQVALKKIRAAIGQDGLARFAEEVRTVGQLEHPNIVPIHDVGVDENGDYFFVMKYVEGQTLESIIEKLAAGDPEAHAHYTTEVRVQIFIGLLRALAYAHDRGIVHRDIKPANIMVGPYGEVVLMDWGIARPVGAAEIPGPDAPPSNGESAQARLVQTQGGGLIGTPAYMSPEQASADPNLDARSDLYSACVVFHELMTLRHYLADKTTIATLLTGVLEKDLPPVFRTDLYGHEHQPPPPAEYLHFLHRGMKKDPEQRWQSAQEMIDSLEAALEGRCAIQCPVTFTKRMIRESGRFVDRHPAATVMMLFGTGLGLVGGIAAGVVALVG
jgi:serine/threonine-protein kinase